MISILDGKEKKNSNSLNSNYDLFSFPLALTLIFSLLVGLVFITIQNEKEPFVLLRVCLESLIPSIITFVGSNIINNIIDGSKVYNNKYKWSLWSLIVLVSYIVVFPAYKVSYTSWLLIPIVIVLSFLNVFFSYKSYKEIRVEKNNSISG